MEPRAAIAEYNDAEEHFTLYTTSQNPHVARLVLSAFYNIAPEHKLRVVAPDVGGGFGSKIFIYPEEMVALWASRKVGRPVKWTGDRSEAFLTDAHGRDHRPSLILEVRLDGDGQRNPQDIDDAALASAVYLCSGPDDLSTASGQRSAVFRYNHSQQYVDLVLAIMHAYMNGDFTSVPNGTTTTSFTFGAPPVTGGHGPHQTRHQGTHHHGHHTPGGNPTQTTATPTSGPTTGPTAGPTGGPTANPTSPSTSLPVTLPTLPTSLPTLPTHAQAVVQCLAEGLVDNPLDPNDAFDQCVYDLTH